jgi:hypothetical protein
MAPTTIHRYEAGANTPDFPELRKLLDYAVKRSNSSAQLTFMSELAVRMGLDLKQINDLTHPIHADPFSQFEVEGKPLDNEERIQVVALLLMLRHSAETTARGVIDAVLQPWREQAKGIVKVNSGAISHVPRPPKAKTEK